MRPCPLGRSTAARRPAPVLVARGSGWRRAPRGSTRPSQLVTDDDRTARPFAGEAWQRPFVRSSACPTTDDALWSAPVSSGSRAPGPCPGVAGTCWSSRRRGRLVTSAPAPRATRASSDSAIPSRTTSKWRSSPGPAGATWKAATGRELLHVTGQVTLGDEDARARHRRPPCPPPERRSRRSRPPRPHSAFPASPLSGPVLLEPDSGVLAADACLRALRQAGGFELRTGTPVTSVRHSSGGVTVEHGRRHVPPRRRRGRLRRTSSRSGSSGSTPAAGSAPSLPQVAYFAPRDGDLPPVFIEWGNDMVYGLPVPGGGPHARHVQGVPACARPRPACLRSRPIRPRWPATTPTNWRN